MPLEEKIKVPLLENVDLFEQFTVAKPDFYRVKLLDTFYLLHRLPLFLHYRVIDEWCARPVGMTTAILKTSASSLQDSTNELLDGVLLFSNFFYYFFKTYFI